MKIFVKGQGPVTLSQADFVGKGGEGSVYARGDVAFKIFTDPNRMIAPSKLAELGAIDDERIITPQALVLDGLGNGGGRAIGYSMRYIQDGYVLCQLFARAFRERHGLDSAAVCRLVTQLAERVRSVHRAGSLVVDLNEMNFLVDRRLDALYAIDADSYQTPSHPATAISPAVMDPRVRQHDFTELSDWFSFAVVSFQMFVGVHPFKGSHPSVKGLSERMRKRLSVFHPDVSLPRVAYPLDAIPPELRVWYRSVLQDGKRSRPPMKLSPVALPATATIITTGGVLDLSLLHDLPARVRRLLASERELWALTDDGLYRDDRRIADVPPGAALALSPRMGTPVLVSIEPDGAVTLLDAASKVKLECALHANKLMEINGRVYLESGGKILELQLLDVGSRVIASTRVATSVLPHATKLFDGVAVQSLLGAAYLSMFPRAGVAHQLRVAELDGARIIDARADGSVAMFLIERGGDYRRLVLRLSSEGNRYDLRDEPAAGPTGINFVTLDTGVCVCLRDDDRIEIFSAKLGAHKLRLIDDGAAGQGVVGGDMLLARWAGKVLCFREGKVYRLSTQ